MDNPGLLFLSEEKDQVSTDPTTTSQSQTPLVNETSPPNENTSNNSSSSSNTNTKPITTSTPEPEPTQSKLKPKDSTQESDTKRTKRERSEKQKEQIEKLKVINAERRKQAKQNKREELLNDLKPFISDLTSKQSSSKIQSLEEQIMKLEERLKNKDSVQTNATPQSDPVTQLQNIPKMTLSEVRRQYRSKRKGTASQSLRDKQTQVKNNVHRLHQRLQSRQLHYV